MQGAWLVSMGEAWRIAIYKEIGACNEDGTGHTNRHKKIPHTAPL